MEYNAIGLTKIISRGGSTLAEYSYLADGARLSALGSDGSQVPGLFDILHGIRPDPLAEKYHGITSYNYCFSNPVLVYDSDGLDGKVVGRGTKNDPYIISSEFFYQNGSLDQQQIQGLEAAIKHYNSRGKNGVSRVKSSGYHIYVKYNLSMRGVDDLESALNSTQFFNTLGESSNYGVIVPMFENQIKME